MVQACNGGAPRESAPGGSVQAGNDHHNSGIRPAEQRQPKFQTAPILATITEALANLSPTDRLELLRWIASRGLLGLAHVEGFAAASEAAYRFGDVLTTGAQ